MSVRKHTTPHTAPARCPHVTVDLRWPPLVYGEWAFDLRIWYIRLIISYLLAGEIPTIMLDNLLTNKIHKHESKLNGPVAFPSTTWNGDLFFGPCGHYMSLPPWIAPPRCFPPVKWPMKALLLAMFVKGDLAAGWLEQLTSCCCGGTKMAGKSPSLRLLEGNPKQGRAMFAPPSCHTLS